MGPVIEVNFHASIAEAVEQTYAAMESTKEAIENAYTSAVDKSLAKMEELSRKQQEQREIVERNMQAVTALAEKRQTASTQEQANIDKEIEKIKMLNAQHEQTILNLEKQRIKLEEKKDIAIGGTDAEIALLKKCNSEYNVMLGTLGDQMKAQQAVGSVVDSSASSMMNLVRQGMSLVGVTSVVTAIAVALRTVDQVLDSIIAKEQAANQGMSALTGTQISQQQSLDKGFAEFGVTDNPAAKRLIQGTLLGTENQASVGMMFGVSAEQTASGFASIAPVLKAHGIQPGDPRFAQLTGTAALFQKQGMSGDLVRNTLSDLLGANAGASADDFNQKLTTMVGVAGSPSFANILGESIYMHRRQAELVGIGDDDIMKMWQAARAKGVLPEEAGEAISAFERSAGRFAGKTDEQRLLVFEAMSGVLNDPKNKMLIDAQRKFRSPQQLLATEMGMSGNADVKAMMTAGSLRDQLVLMSGMSPEQLDRVATANGGNRMTANAQAVAGWANQTITPGGLTGPAITPEQHTTALNEYHQNLAAMNQPLSPAGQSFGDSMPLIEQYMGQHQDMYPMGMSPQSWLQTSSLVPSKLLMGGVTPQMYQRQVGLGYELVQAAKLLDDPSIPAAAKAQIRQNMQTLIGFMGYGGKQTPIPDSLKALMGDSAARKSVMGGLTDFDKEMGFVSGVLQDNQKRGEYVGWQTDDSILNNKKLGGALDAIDAQRMKYHYAQPTTQPTTQPSSINYNIRQTNYGYSPSSVGQPMPNANNYG